MSEPVAKKRNEADPRAGGGRASRPDEVTIRMVGGRVEVRGEENPTRRAFYRWMAGVAAQAVETAPARALEDAVTEPSVRSGLLGVVEALPPSPDVSELTRLREEALTRGLRARQELEERAGGFRTTAWVAEHLGVTRQAVDRKRRTGRLLSILGPDGTYGYPFVQFDRTGVAPGLERALAAFEVDDPWMRLAGLVNPAPALAGRSVLEALDAARSEEDRERVLAVVRAYFAE